MKQPRWRHDGHHDQAAVVGRVSAEAGAEPRIRVYDVVAQGSTAAGLDAAVGRQIDLPVTELTRLLEVLGADGLRAFCLYLEHLEQVPGIDGELVLGVPHFSARWLLAASAEAADRTGAAPMTKNAATRGHQAVERSGLLHALANAPALAGQGARGRTWRAVLNPRLVVIRGGRDDLDDLPQVRRGRPRKDKEAPVSRLLGNRDRGPGFPLSGDPGNPEVSPLSREPGLRDAGAVVSASSLVGAASLVSTIPDSTSEVGVVQELLSSRDRPGLLAAVLVPLLRSDRIGAAARLRVLFNDALVGERAADTVTALALPLEETRRPDILSDLLVATLLGERDTPADLRRLGVSGTPALSAPELRERMVLGLLIGWGLRRVESWGAWLYQATRPGWAPKPGPLLDRFTTLVRELIPASAAPPGASSKPVAALPAATLRPLPGAADHAAAEVPAEEMLLPEDIVTQHFAAARRKWPMLCRDGSAQATDPTWRSRLVRMYLAAQERQAELDTTEQVVSR